VAWEKSGAELTERFGRILDRFPDVTRRKMFGYPAGFIGGNMVTGLHQASWIVRLDGPAQDEARAAGATTFDPMGGRPMKNYVALPEAIVEDDEAIATWVGRAVEHGRTLPPKSK
jgi:TfoX/Sxy family transcriptional regulator of competence genes